jgi:hypothetical protein
MSALKSASVDGDIRPFAKFLAALLRGGMRTTRKNRA